VISPDGSGHGWGCNDIGHRSYGRGQGGETDRTTIIPNTPNTNTQATTSTNFTRLPNGQQSRGSGQTWRNINRQLGRITQVTLAGPAGTVTQTTPLNLGQKAVYQALSIQPPARVTAFDPT